MERLPPAKKLTMALGGAAEPRLVRRAAAAKPPAETPPRPVENQAQTAELRAVARPSGAVERVQTAALKAAEGALARAAERTRAETRETQVALRVVDHPAEEPREGRRPVAPPMCPPPVPSDTDAPLQAAATRSRS